MTQHWAINRRKYRDGGLGNKDIHRHIRVDDAQVQDKPQCSSLFPKKVTLIRIRAGHSKSVNFGKCILESEMVEVERRIEGALWRKVL